MNTTEHFLPTEIGLANIKMSREVLVECLQKRWPRTWQLLQISANGPGQYTLSALGAFIRVNMFECLLVTSSGVCVPHPRDIRFTHMDVFERIYDEISAPKKANAIINKYPTLSQFVTVIPREGYFIPAAVKNKLVLRLASCEFTISHGASADGDYGNYANALEEFLARIHGQRAERVATITALLPQPIAEEILEHY